MNDQKKEKLLKQKQYRHRSCEGTLGLLNADKIYIAYDNYGIGGVVDELRKDIKARKDLSPEFVEALLSQDLDKGEITYYPVYFYRTVTDLSWTTTEKTWESSIRTKDGEDVGDVWRETTYSHKKTGITGTSHYYCAHGIYTEEELRIESIDEKQLREVTDSKSAKLTYYTEHLTYDEKTHKSFAESAGRRAAGATRSQKSQTRYTTVALLVPVFKYTFVYEGEFCMFEMNLHNGTYITEYCQKSPYAAFKKYLPAVYNKTVGVLIFDIAILLLHIFFSSFIVEWVRILLGAVAAIGSAVFWRFGEEKNITPSSYQHERMLSRHDFKGISKKYLPSTLLFDLSILAANVSAGLLFRISPIVILTWLLSAALIAGPIALYIKFRGPEILNDIKEQFADEKKKWEEKKALRKSCKKSSVIICGIYNFLSCRSWVIIAVSFILALIINPFHPEIENMIFGAIGLGGAVFLCVLQGNMHKPLALEEFDRTHQKITLPECVKMFWKMALMTLAIFAVSLIFSLFFMGDM